MPGGRKKIKRKKREATRFAKTLAALMRRRGLTASELARRARIYRSLASRITTGTTFLPDAAHVTKLATVFPLRKDRAALLAAYALDCLAACGSRDAALVRVTVRTGKPAKARTP